MAIVSQAEIISFGEDQNWSIEPQGSLFDLRLGELWRYRELVMLFVRRGFVAIYRQTIHGSPWRLIAPPRTDD